MSTMEAELYAAAQGYNLLESVSAILQEIEPNAFDRILAIDNSSAVSMCSGGPGSQRTRHLKVRASYIREAVKNGRLRVCHTPGEQQLADLATKLLTKERLWQLLELWGFIGGRLTKMFEAAKMKVIAIMMMLISLVSPVDGADSEEEGSSIQVSGWDELLVVSGLLCISAIAGSWSSMLSDWGGGLTRALERT